ncbi:17760_t:CDS:2 [Cetraspora pellucida]|uniref:17760_t:CDS:1 n=1 Tax=Cetraspora pellucida TaxID=1433469 RepID=A0ACA9KK00_9GLOM|nr:17760_t:CDS:2 [Cetraspora pellucida]
MDEVMQCLRDLINMTHAQLMADTISINILPDLHIDEIDNH